MDSTNEELVAVNLFDVKGLVAVVTGGGTGIGLMITRALVCNGAKRVYIVGRRLEVLQTTAKEYQVEQDQIVPLQADMSDKGSIAKMKEALESREKSIDLLINNASVVGPKIDKEAQTVESIAESLWSADESEARKVLETNVLGYYYASAALLPLLGRSANDPQIINVSSMGAFSRRAMSGMVYSLSKASVTHFTKILATHLSKTNVRCNAIAQGMYIKAEGLNERTASKTKGVTPVKIPVDRPGTDQEMAAAVMYLVSKNQRFTSGSIILSDGGYLNILPSAY